jgi:cysteine desulfurase / selenocysteine lyase
MSSFPLSQVRSDTPGCSSVLHFNNAGSSLITRQALDETISYLQQEATVGGYEAARLANNIIEKVYDSAARLINANRDEIALVENATRAWDMAFYAIQFQPGDRILVSTVEYASNYIAFLQIARKMGVVVEPIAHDAFGQVSIEALKEQMDERVKLIAITHVPTNGGLVNPAAEIGKVAKEAGVLYLLDACQSVGQMPIDVEAIGCDMLSATGRKYLRAPRGTGFLYVRRAIMERLEPPFLDLHAATWKGPNQFEMRPDARRFETFESNMAGKIGLGAAIDYALNLGLENTYPRIVQLAAHLRERLRTIATVQVHDLGAEPCGIVTFTLAGKESLKVRDALFAQGINVSVTTPSHTLLDSEERKLRPMVRASVHYYNSEEEVERFAAAIEEIAKNN